MEFDERPSDGTIRRVLQAGKLDVIDHTDGSRFYRLADDALGERVRWVRR